MGKEIFELKQSDPLFGKKGRRVTSDVYNLLPESLKVKFKSLGKMDRFINGTDEMIAIPSSRRVGRVSAANLGNSIWAQPVVEFIESEGELEVEF